MNKAAQLEHAGAARDPLAPHHRYSTTAVPVTGGELHLGVWEPVAVSDPPTVLLIHGVTASHRAFDLLAADLTGVRVIAPDLRGRGRSARVTGTAGMEQHARDMVAVLDAFEIQQTLVVGHSMGGFVSVVLARLFPERVTRLILIDGGLPLEVPEGLDADQIIQAILGPTAERLAMRFESPEAYVDFWRQHPGFANYWIPFYEEYFSYDLLGEAPELQPAARYEAARDDTVDLTGNTAVIEGLLDAPRPMLLLTCPRGLFDQTPGLFAPDRLSALLEEYPRVEHTLIDDTNHYTIVMSESGAARVAEIVREALAPRVP